MAKSKDLFDDTTMSFGEHLEVLRVHLWKALIGLALCVLLALFIGTHVVALIRAPLDAALREYGLEYADEEYTQAVEEFDFWDYMQSWFREKQLSEGPSEHKEVPPPPDRTAVDTEFNAFHFLRELHEIDSRTFPAPEKELRNKTVKLRLSSRSFAELRQSVERIDKPITLNVQEAFLTYLKVSFVAGFVMASPWIFFQLWMFVAAGLYPHEQRYVYIYLPLSMVLFLGGVTFCFYLVFPFVLKFLLGFNSLLGVTPQIRLSEWISFAVMLPLMFGISFQLPLVMLFLERISIFDVRAYREKRRLAILVISILSMMLTPADPMSMILMMIPLVVLYELGILMCDFAPSTESPFESEAS